MKKSLLIILSLIFCQISTLAVGVDCWEEYSRTFNPNTVSRMKSSLGNNVTITRVKTNIVTTGVWNATIPLEPNVYLVQNQSSKYYYLTFSPITLSNITRSNSYLYQKITNLYTLDETNNYGYLYHYFYYGSGNYTYSLGDLTINGAQISMYVHTYCIVSDHSSSGGGGGGGAAGAAVNYIIKAD